MSRSSVNGRWVEAAVTTSSRSSFIVYPSTCKHSHEGWSISLNRIKCSLTSAEAISKAINRNKTKLRLSVEAITTTTHTWDTSSRAGRRNEKTWVYYSFTVGRVSPRIWLCSIIFITISCRHNHKTTKSHFSGSRFHSKQNQKLSEFLEAIGLWNYHLIVFFFALLFYHSSGNET